MLAAGGYILGWILDQPRSHLGPNNTRYVSEYSYTTPPPLLSPVVTYVSRIHFTSLFSLTKHFQNIYHSRSRIGKYLWSHLLVYPSLHALTLQHFSWEPHTVHVDIRYSMYVKFEYQGHCLRLRSNKKIFASPYMSSTDPT